MKDFKEDKEQLEISMKAVGELREWWNKWGRYLPGQMLVGIMHTHIYEEMEKYS